MRSVDARARGAGWHAHALASSLLVCAALSACNRATPPAQQSTPDTNVVEADRPPAPAPWSQAERRTTSGTIALRNLSAEIDVLERSVATRAPVAGAVDLVDRLLTRAVCLGRVADYERAALLADDLVQRAPQDARSYWSRARTRAALHRFGGTLEDLAAAERHGQPGDDVAAMRADVLEEMGEPEEARAIRQRLGAARRDVFALGAEAVDQARQGKLTEAERLFAAAQAAYQDVSPFPLAWLYLQQGLMWERAGDERRALPFFEAAVERLPGYAPAVSHLAAIEARAGHRDRAVTLLRTLVSQSDDPEYLGQLAGLLQVGDRVEGERLRAAAGAGFDALTARHPEAFAAKAARFWLGPGNDPQRALHYARANLGVRRTAEDRQLLAEAEAAVQKPAAAGS